jgi:uncharacterized protein YhfF
MPTLPDQYADLMRFSFGDSPAMADQLLGLVLAGAKTASCAALQAYRADNEPVPLVGQRYLVLDGRNEPAAVVEMTAVDICRFEDIGPDFTDREGEGDYAAWRAGHQAYFSRTGGFSPGMDIVCEQFRLVEVLDRSPIRQHP